MEANGTKAVTVEAFVSKIHCWRCAATLERTLATEQGIERATLDPVTGRLRLTLRPDVVTFADVVDALTGAGTRSARRRPIRA